MTCPTCKGRCRTVLAVIKRGPAFAKVLPTVKLPLWAFAGRPANDVGRPN